MEEYRKFAVTFSGLTCLQLPAVISGAQKGSALSNIQALGFPLNMSKTFMEHHLSFSNKNMKQGRYYTLVTSLFNHADPSHLLTNLMILVSSGRIVHAEIGQRRFLAAFLGGGIAGNLAMWLHYLADKGRLQNGIISPIKWPMLENTAIGHSLDSGKRKILSSSFDYLNSWLSCIGCSACVSAVVSLETCIMLETLVPRLRQAVQRNMLRQHGDPIEEDLELMYDLARVGWACIVTWSDLKAVIGSWHSGGGFFAHTFSPVGHSGHIGGFLFGILYYFVCRR